MTPMSRLPLLLALLGPLAAAGCSPPPGDEVRSGPHGAVVTRLHGSDLETALWRREGDAVVCALQLRWLDDEAAVIFAPLGQPRLRHDVPAWRGRVTAQVWRDLVDVVLPLWAEGCPAEGCPRAWNVWGDDPAAPALAPTGRSTAEAALATGPLGVAPPSSIEAAVTSCGPFPGYRGDQVCTGWIGRVFTVGGARDAHGCCLEHDACFFDCPLEDGACRGTACIDSCNLRLANCCLEHGGDDVQCSIYEVATDLAGGGGRNGCGRDKALAFCAEQGLGGGGCEVDRCVCEECAALVEDDLGCEACACADECDPAEPPSCAIDGVGHIVRSCQPSPWDGGCHKLADRRCNVGEACQLDPTGQATCVAAACPFAQPCSFDGEVEPHCRVDDVGPYYRVCVGDQDGCLIWERRYCADVAGDACVVLDDGPVCVARP